MHSHWPTLLTSNQYFIEGDPLAIKSVLFCLSENTLISPLLSLPTCVCVWCVNLCICVHGRVHVYVCRDWHRVFSSISLRLLYWSRISHLPLTLDEVLLALRFSLIDFPLLTVWSLCPWSSTTSEGSVVFLCLGNTQTGSSLNSLSQYVSQPLWKDFVYVAACPQQSGTMFKVLASLSLCVHSWKGEVPLRDFP